MTGKIDQLQIRLDSIGLVFMDYTALFYLCIEMPCTGDFQTFYKTLPCLDLFELGLAYHSFFFLALTFSHDLSFYGLKFGCALQLHVKKKYFFFACIF